MKKIYLLTLGVVASAASFAQTPNLKISEGNNLLGSPKGLNIERSSEARGTSTCVDTVAYSLYNSLNSSGGVDVAFISLQDSLTTLKGAGLFFPKEGTQNITISGIEFYAIGVRADGMPSSSVVSLFAAGSDSLPMGSALATQTISLDTNSVTFGDITNLFSFTPVTLTTGFVLTVEAGSPVDSIAYYSGVTTSGAFDGFPVTYSIGGAWNRYPGTAIGAYTPWFNPIISYDATNTLVSSVVQLSMPNESVVFTSTYPEVGRSILSLSGWRGNNTAAINFGDGSAILDPSISETHVYVDETQDYDVVLTDSIQLYRGNSDYCVVTETLTIIGAGPNGINDIDSKKVKAFVMENNITVQNAEGLVTIYSITGAVVKKAYVSATTQTIDASDLNDGVYILTVNDQAIKFKL